MTESEFSLLYPEECGRTPNVGRWGVSTAIDLAIDEIAWALSINNKYHGTVKAILLELRHDTDVIAYRQEILEDFLNCPVVAAGFEELLPLFAKLRDYAETRSWGIPLQETLGRLTELNT
jgi:hypothetical protein